LPKCGIMLSKESVFKFLRKRSDKIAGKMLEPDETLLWSGVPGFVDVISSSDLRLLPFFALNAALIFILFSRLEYRAFFENWYQSSVKSVLVPVYDYIVTAEIIHILVLLVLLVIRLLFRYAKTAGNIYAVTDRRVFVTRRNRINCVIEAHEIKSIAVSRRLFGGSIVFNSENGEDYFKKGGSLCSHRKDAFFNIADLDGALNALNIIKL